MIKDLDTGQVAFRVSGYSRQAPIASPVIRWGFRLFGRWTQERFYRNIQRRMYRLTQATARLAGSTGIAAGHLAAPAALTAGNPDRCGPSRRCCGASPRW